MANTPIKLHRPLALKPILRKCRIISHEERLQRKVSLIEQRVKLTATQVEKKL